MGTGEDTLEMIWSWENEGIFDQLQLLATKLTAGSCYGPIQLPAFGRQRPAGAEIHGPRGWLHLEGAFVCSSFKQHALLKQVTVEGALCSKASCVVLVEASRVAGERGCGPDRGRGAQCELHERCHSRPPRRYRDRRMSFPPHLARAASRCAWSAAASSA